MEIGQRKKILFVITKSVWGGAQRYVFDLATNLPQDEFEIAVAYGLSENTTHENLAKKLRGNSWVALFPITYFQKSINPFKEMISFFEILSACFHFKPDVIHVNSSKAAGIAGFAGCLYQFISRHRVRRIFTVHGWAFLELWRPEWQQMLIRFFSKLTTFLHTHIIVISKCDHDAALSYNVVPSSKVTLIPNGIGNITFADKKTAQRELLGSEHALVVGTIAEWTQNKGLTYLIEAMPAVLKEFPDTHLYLVGWGELEKNFQFLISNFQLRKNITLVSKSAASEYLKAFDIFVLPSLKEGLPYTIIEAGLAGLPVVATRVGGVPDIIEHGTHGLLVDPASPQQLANTIIRLGRDKNLRDTLGKKLHGRVVQNFSLETMVEKTTALYRS